jgi:hypothetical protein
MVLDASMETLCCDEPDLVTKYNPLVACRKCGLVWEREYPITLHITVKFVSVATEDSVFA